MQQTPAKQINKTTRAVPEELRYAQKIFPEFFTPATLDFEQERQEALFEEFAKKLLLRADMELLLSLEVFCKG